MNWNITGQITITAPRKLSERAAEKSATQIFRQILSTDAFERLIVEYDGDESGDEGRDHFINFEIATGE